MDKAKIYIKSILIPLVLGGIVGLIISQTIDYDSLQKPFLAPPSILFPIVWTILYILMGISQGILKSNGVIDKETNEIYYLQLVVNLVWPIAFFLLKSRLFSAIWIILLDILVIIMVIKFYKKNKTAGLLQIPYLLWTLFATYLNIAIYVLNN